MKGYNNRKGPDLRWAILGTGVVANEMAQALRNAGKSAYAVGNRTHSKAMEFGKKYQIPKVYDNYQQMFDDEEIDVIYITTPHNTHIEFLKKALAGRKHVLCEKSITLNSAELNLAAKMAEENHVVLAEAMTIYHMPLYKKLRQLVSSGSLGPVRMIQLNFGSYKEYDMSNRFFNKSLAGGALLDIGVYAISLARSFMDSKPLEIASLVKYAPSGADEQSGIVMMNPQGQMAVMSLSLHSKQPKRCVISCDRAYIEIMEYPRAEEALIVYTQSGDRETICLGNRSQALQYEMEDMEKAISGDRQAIDDMLLPYSIDVMDLMTSIRRQWGMYYESEKADTSS